MRPGDFGVGVCVRVAIGGTARTAVGTASVGSRIHQCDREGEQGKGCAGGKESGGCDGEIYQCGPAQAGDGALAGECFFDEARNAVCGGDDVAEDQAAGEEGGDWAERYTAYVAA